MELGLCSNCTNDTVDCQLRWPPVLPHEGMLPDGLLSFSLSLFFFFRCLPGASRPASADFQLFDSSHLSCRFCAVV